MNKYIYYYSHNIYYVKYYIYNNINVLKHKLNIIYEINLLLKFSYINS